MNSEQAREILRGYRPGVDDATDVEIRDALVELERDPALAAWFKEHRALQSAIAAKFKKIQPPPDLKAQILRDVPAPGKIIPCNRPALWAAAAVIILSLTFAALYAPRADKTDFESFRDRMVQKTLRDYRMDMVTNDLPAIRQYLAAKNAHADFTLPPGLAKLPGQGCAILKWHDQTVSLVCLEPSPNKTLYLYIIDRAAIAEAPSGNTPQITQIKKLTTAAWSDEKNEYLLASFDNEQSLRRYLQF
jgi:hypothetical protein